MMRLPRLRCPACLVLGRPVSSGIVAPALSRPLSSSGVLFAKSLPPRPKPPPESDIEESFLKGSGPGGQKINKTNSAVQLRHIPTGVVVKSQATRSRDQNRKHAREILAQRLDELQNGDHSRTALVADIKRKRASSADKKKRRKYKLLDEVKSAASSSDADAGVVEQAPAETRSEVQAQLQADDVSEQPKCEPGQLGSTVNPEVNTKR